MPELFDFHEEVEEGAEGCFVILVSVVGPVRFEAFGDGLDGFFWVVDVVEDAESDDGVEGVVFER